MTISSLNDLQMPTSLQATKSIINPDSSTSSDKSNRVTFTDKVNSTQRLSSLIAEGHVLEEDDLESVVSDRDSFYQVNFINSILCKWLSVQCITCDP